MNVNSTVLNIIEKVHEHWKKIGNFIFGISMLNKWKVEIKKSWGEWLMEYKLYYAKNSRKLNFINQKKKNLRHKFMGHLNEKILMKERNQISFTPNNNNAVLSNIKQWKSKVVLRIRASMHFKSNTYIIFIIKRSMQ